MSFGSRPTKTSISSSGWVCASPPRCHLPHLLYNPHVKLTSIPSRLSPKSHTIWSPFPGPTPRSAGCNTPLLSLISAYPGEPPLPVIVRFCSILVINGLIKCPCFDPFDLAGCEPLEIDVALYSGASPMV